MKRSLVVVLVFSFVALPLFAEHAKISKARCVSLEHVRGAWVMKVECAEGAGTISLADVGKALYRGDGVFSKWSQDQMRAMYESLIPKDDGSTFELMQLG